MSAESPVDPGQVRAAAAPARSALDRIFDPASIAVVGASTDPAKRGHQILLALRESGYSGSVYPVNPRGGEIAGYAVSPSVDALPEGVDLAVLCTPASSAPEIVRSCGERSVAGAVVLAVGFGESGERGRSLEAELVTAAREAGVRLIGPNTSGFLNLERGVNLVGARGVRSGGLAVLVQSGNMALTLMTEVTERSWEGISIYLGVGNEVDLGFGEALEYLEDHATTRAVLAYAEGFRDAGRFLETAARVSRSKPIVAIKSGRTKRGAEAALSHTGAVAGPYARLSAGLAQAGVVELTRGDELLHVAETLGRQPACDPGKGIAILSDGGGQGTMAVDFLIESGARLADLSEATRQALRTRLGPAAAVGNPVDLAGAADGNPEAFGDVTRVLVEDPDVGAVLVVGLFGGYGIRFAESLTEPECRAAEVMAEAGRASGRGMVVHTMYALHRSAPLAVLGAAGVPVVASLDVACRCVVELQRRGRWLAREPWAYRRPRPGEGADRHRPLTEPEARELLTEAGADFGPSVLARSAEDVVAALGRLGAPVAVKLVSSTITHKSDAGGVVLGVSSAEEALDAYERIGTASAEWATRQGLASAKGVEVLVVPMRPAPRVELLVGAYRDAQIGPVVTLGAGGVWVEAMADTAVRVLPVSDSVAEEMLSELRIGQLLAAGRGRGAVDRGPILQVLRAVAKLIESNEAVAEVEINPLFVYDDGVSPIDARIVVGDSVVPLDT